MNLLNLIEDTTTGYDNLRALMQASQSGQDAVLNVGGETVTLDPMETRWMFGKYKSFNKAGRQEEFLNHLADPVKFDQHMKQLRQLIDKQKNFQGSVPGQRGVTGDTMPGQMEEDQTVEEIAMQDPNNMTPQTRGKLNWENMIRDYMGNKPYTEFEFSGDRPLTVYRSQVYAILKAFGSMKPQNKVNIILNTFGDKIATVEYLDKLRAKGLMPKKVPAYVPPGTEPVPPGQMDLPGMATPKIREADDQKKNPKTTDLDGAVNPRVARAMQLARARQSAAGTDTEAMVADFVDQQEKDQAEFNKVKSVNQRQDDLLKQVTAVNQQQDREIDSLDADNADLQANLQQLQAVNADLAKKLADVGQRRADRQQEPQQAPAQPAATPAEPKDTVEPPLQQPAAPATTATTAQPAPVKKKKATTRKKSSATKVQRPQQDVPNNVLPFRRPEPAVAQDELSAALQGVDMDGELGTGTYGLKENTETLNVGDPVIISGNVEFNGKTGDVVGFGRDQHFVIVDLYNFGKHAFHASNVEYNDYADEEDTIDEMQTKLDRYNVNQPPPGGTNKQREEFLNARDRLFRQMQSASPGEKEAIRLKIAELEGQAQSQGIKIRETDDLSRSGYNAIKSLSDWAEKMRVMRELQKDIALMSDPESKAAVQQRIGDLLKVGIKQGYVKEALNDKAMSVLRSLKQPAQPAPATVDLNVPEPVSEPAMDLATVRKRIAQLDELIRMKEQIDKLFVRAQNARGGIYPGLQSDIEDEELYSVPQSDKEYQILKDKYTKDLTALQKFIAMKKAVYREGQEIVGESSALVRLKQARQALSQQGMAEAQTDYQRRRQRERDVDAGKPVARQPKNPQNDYFARRKKEKKHDMDEAISKKDLLGRLQKDLPKVTDPKNKDAKPVVWTGAGKDDYGYTGYQGHGMPTDKQERELARKKKGVAESINEGLLYSGDTWQDVLYRINVLNDIFGDQKDLAASFEPASQPEWGPFRDRILRSRTVLDTYAKVKQLANMNVPLTDVEIEMLADVAWDGGGGPVEPAGHWGERDYDWLEDLYAQQFAIVQHLLDQKAQGRGQNRTKSGQTVHEQGVAEGLKSGEYHIHTVYFKDGTKKRVRVTSDEFDVVGYYTKRGQAVDRVDYDFQIHSDMSEQTLDEKQDACYNKVKSRYKVWPSAYASGALVQCRKKGADNWGEGGKKK